ncbi:MAG: hypothetical protein ACXAB4_10890 [Candidatus Hodarchaeales archaeon]|jgi:hypothetical protein
MKINGDIKKNSLIASVLGLFLALTVVGSVLLLPNLDLFDSSEMPGPGPEPAMGARIAQYIDARSSDVSFAWCYNNTVVNVNLTALLGAFTNGILISSPPSGVGTANVTAHISFGVTFGTTTSSKLDIVVNAFETALSELETISETVSDWMDIWPPTFMWDIAYSDGTSLSLVYSQEQHVIAVVNGTWSTSDCEVEPGIIVPFPSFEYNWTSYNNRAFLVLDEASEGLVLSAIQAYIDLVGEALLFD